MSRALPQQIALVLATTLIQLQDLITPDVYIRLKGWALDPKKVEAFKAAKLDEASWSNPGAAWVADFSYEWWVQYAGIEGIPDTVLERIIELRSVYPNEPVYIEWFDRDPLAYMKPDGQRVDFGAWDVDEDGSPYEVDLR